MVAPLVSESQSSSIEETDEQQQQYQQLARRRTIQSDLVDIEAESISSALPEGFNYEKKTTATRFLDKTQKYYPVILNIVHGAIWGVLVRKGLMLLTTYSGSFLSGVIWANFAACVVMGLAIDGEVFWIRLLEEKDYPNKGAIPVYTGLTTGFCGTVSSFSSVILEAFNKAADTDIGVRHHYPNGAYGIMQFLAVILAQFGLSIMGFHMGKQFLAVVDNYLPLVTKRIYKVLELTSMILGVVLVVITCILIGVKKQGSWRSWTFSMLFAPFGALLRYYLSKFLNNKVSNFPLGTFTANFLGTLLLAVFTLLARGKLPGGKGHIVTNTIALHVLEGLDDGFCGGLTTVSTFVVELFGLKTLFSYRYGTISILVCFAGVVLILGSYNWSVGLD